MTPDRKDVVSHLQIMHTWASFALEHGINFFKMAHINRIAEWTDDALELLKEQDKIVRCKDCKWCEMKDGWAYCRILGEIIPPERYCEIGERRDADA